MNKLVLLTLTMFFCGNLLSQTTTDAYFQQEVNYDMDVRLDDEQHRLDGTVDMEYTNHSPDELSEIFLHLWPNAYKNRNTSLGQQLLENGDKDFYFAKRDALGKFMELDIRINGKVVEWDYWEKMPDVAQIILSKPLKSGEKLEINTSFLLKIPESFSRLGHVEQSYQMTQWYPKPAVYDHKGWHPMPYLDQGEFYSEFGNFDVKITLPSNYVVGATGVLQNEEEIAFLNEKVEATQKIIKSNGFEHVDNDSFPPSSGTSKTIRYLAENVHDFAWFADKRFHVDKSEVTLASGKTVDTYVMFTGQQSDKWAKAIEYVNRSVKFYSAEVGEYPYPQATAVQSALSAGAGMEYPMITVIGLSGSDKSLDEVITHEVGHNWFYGILASNEREFAWMDEGFNSFYEQKYMSKYYKKKESYLGYDKVSGVSPGEANQLSFYIPMRRHDDQPINTPSQDLTLMNYWMTAYDKPAYLLHYLESYLGAEAFDEMMQTYFERWKFKHPYPEDVRKVFEEVSGKDLSWWFDGLINTTDHLDYKAEKINRKDGSYELTITNKGEIIAPFPVQVQKDGEYIETVWVEGFEGEKNINIPVSEADKFVIDANKKMPDFNRRNNTITSKGGKMEPFKFKFLGGVENPDRTTIYWTPIVGLNKYNGFMAGLSMYNTLIPSKSFEWSVAPMFGFRSKDVTGLANLTYHLYPESLQRVSLGLGYKGFSYFENSFYKDEFGASADLDYHRINPKIEIEFKNKRARSKYKQTLTIEGRIIAQQQIGTLAIVEPDTALSYSGHEVEWRVIPKLSYELKKETKINPFSIRAALEQESYDTGTKANYLKFSAEAKVQVNYSAHSAIKIRIFGGGFLMNSKKELLSAQRGAFSLLGTGNADWTFDNYYFGRNEMSGMFSQQVNDSQGGGFKVPLSEDSSSSFGMSNVGVMALNVKIDPPFKMPNMFKIRLYADIGFALDKSEGGSTTTLFNSGLAISVFQDIFEIYLPFYFKGGENVDPTTGIGASKNLATHYLSKGNYGSRITFKLHLNRLNPFKYAYNFDL